MTSELPIVVVTGITGYVGSQTCLSFLKSGKFRVRGTVRSTQNEAKLAPLKKAFGVLYNQLELVEADLLNEESLFKAIEGATYVAHTASPFPGGLVWNSDTVVRPAVNGTISVLKAAQQNKVKRVVITSSVAAMMGTLIKERYTRDDWSDPNHQDPYCKSKTLAERAAWEF